MGWDLFTSTKSSLSRPISPVNEAHCILNNFNFDTFINILGNFDAFINILNTFDTFINIWHCFCIYLRNKTQQIIYLEILSPRVVQIITQLFCTVFDIQAQTIQTSRSRPGPLCNICAAAHYAIIAQTQKHFWPTRHTNCICDNPHHVTMLSILRSINCTNPLCHSVHILNPYTMWTAWYRLLKFYGFPRKQICKCYCQVHWS